MHEVPPENDRGPQEQPFVAYYRGASPGADAARLRALAEGYWGLNWVFLINVLLAIGLNFIGFALSSQSIGLFPATIGAFTLATYGFLFVTIALLSYSQIKKIAFGKEWRESSTILSSLLLAINSVVCCGIIGYVVLQQIAYIEMKKYGVRTGFLGVRKADIEAKIAEIQAAQASSGTGFQA